MKYLYKDINPINKTRNCFVFIIKNQKDLYNIIIEFKILLDPFLKGFLLFTFF
jgi:hypothetical protein